MKGAAEIMHTNNHNVEKWYAKMEGIMLALSKKENDTDIQKPVRKLTAYKQIFLFKFGKKINLFS